ncbi:hypothetical protein HBR93_21530 [Pseudomonas sp. WS 5411]|uniref:hypothetical protein n=1 Tax=Pseudomonas sp. WS 5411 TaxID=2717486 RepID=UPI0014751CAB|nr:hypothetical protein [Pseudomonas sp. WS 5411]NMY86689.1 hypothetical protein [Pseudomonas sp. WS 5411]
MNQRKSDTIRLLLETDKIRSLTGAVVVEDDIEITLNEMLCSFPLDSISARNAVLPVRFFCDVDPCRVPSLESLFSDFKMPGVFGLDQHIAVQLAYARQFQALNAIENEAQDIFSRSTFPLAAQHLS